MNALTNGATIIVPSTGNEFHTLDDWGLAIGNTNYISEPEQETNYIEVPAMNGFIDLSETLTGRPTFKNRSISIELGGKRESMAWDTVISDFRNKIHGRLVHIIFDNDPSYYWQGRAYVNSFDRMRRLGTFALEIPQADPYKYELTSSAEPWLWDPFNFLTGVIRNYGDIDVVGSETVDIPAGFMPVTPTFIVSRIQSETFTVRYKNKTFTLMPGSNYLPEIVINGDEEISLLFTGTANVIIQYRGGSL